MNKEIKMGKFFARKGIMHFSEDKVIEVFQDIYPCIQATRMHGDGPYYEIEFREAKEGEDSPYWGWKDFEQKQYILVYPHKGLTEMCFPYGSSVEEKRGKGKLVNLVLEGYKIFE